MAHLRKSARNRMLFGVAGGLAEYFHVDPAIIRALFIVTALASGVGVFIYVVLALLMARPDTLAAEPMAVVKDNLRSAPREASAAAKRAVHLLRGPAETGASAETNGPAESRSGGTTVR